MNYWRSGLFWASLVICWFVATFTIGVFWVIFGPSQLTPTERAFVNTAIPMLSFVAAFAHARWHFNRKHR